MIATERYPLSWPMAYEFLTKTDKWKIHLKDSNWPSHMSGQQSWMSGPGKNGDDYSQLLKEEGFELVGAKINDWTFDWTDEVAKGFIESYALKDYEKNS